MSTLEKVTIPNVRTETDGLGEVEVAANVLWDAETQRSLEHHDERGNFN
jgi:fumarate hydratase class II